MFIQKNKKIINILIVSVFLIFIPKQIFAMHIMEGYLPAHWAVLWGVVTLPFIILGLNSIGSKVSINPRIKMLLAVAGAYAFVLSALKIPSVTGSSSHPTGVGLGAILFGPSAMSVLGLIVLIFQAVLLAHGGITTLGANAFSMAVIGPLAAFGIYKLIDRLKGPKWLAVFLAASIGNLLTYIVTSFQLALAHPSPTGGFMESLVEFTGIFALTQIPLAISEGILTVVIFNFIMMYSSNDLRDLKILSEEV